MSLSEYEKQVLADLESQLRDIDQDVVRPRPVKNSGVNFSARTIAWMISGILVGAAILLLGVSQGYTYWGIGIGVVGFLIMFAAITLPWNPLVGSKQPPRAAAPRQPRQRGNFMERQQEKWDRRQQEH